MMSHRQNHQAIIPNLVDEAEWELGEHKSADALHDERSSVRVLTNTDKS
jgi:hypothetical protein